MRHLPDPLFSTTSFVYFMNTDSPAYSDRSTAPGGGLSPRVLTMRTPLRLVLSAVVAGLFGLSSAVAEEPAAPKEQPRARGAEQKEIEERLERLTKELDELEAKKRAEAAKPGAVAPTTPPVYGWRMPALTAPAQPVQDPAGAALRGLLKSQDPKVVSLATELLERLGKSAAPPAVARVVPGDGAGAPLRVEVEAWGHKQRAPAELKVEPPAAERVRVRTVVLNERGEAAKTGQSRLRMSADGKTAAVVGADGSVTVFDTTTGKELMRFPAKE
ncbi:MAG: hypothetical protein JWO38_5519 [Gemmataceae bacterium]|nr:hypothetical protein [Gemmataceae bacterium]